MTLPAALATLARRYPDLPPRLQHAARFIIDNPDQIAVRSMREIARRAAVAPATMVRLARALDFADYDDMRDVIIRRGESTAASHASSKRCKQASATAPGWWSILRRRRWRRSSAAAIGSRDRRVRAPAGARPTVALGMRASHAIAFHFAYVYLCGQDSSTTAVARCATMRRVSRAATLIAIGSLPTRATGGRRGCRTARRDDLYYRQRGVRSASRPSHPVVPRGRPSFFSTMVGALALAEVLVARLAASGGRAVIARLERTDEALREAGAYSDATWTRFPIGGGNATL
jgi:hypothetical protein